MANLTLMRGVRRQHELVVRAALGAGVARLRRLLLVENLLLALLGALLGVLVAGGGVRLLTSLAERYSPRASEIRLDGVVLSFTLALSVTVALLLSFLASLPREGGLASRILAGGQRTSGGLSRQRLQRGLVVVQIAVSLVLPAGAGLLTRTMLRLAEVDTGLGTEEVLTMQVSQLTWAERCTNPAAVARARECSDRMLDEIPALPDVVEVGAGSMPLRHTDLVRDIRAEGRPLAVGEATPRAELRFANPDYFRAAGIPLLQGRGFSTTVRPDSAIVVLINQTLADRLFPGNDPLGQRSAWTSGTDLTFEDSHTIIGVVGNTQDGGLDAAPRGRGVPVGGVRGTARESAGDPRREQRLRPCGHRDAGRSTHRADGAPRKRADRGPAQGSEHRAPASQRRTGLIVRHAGGDHRGGGDRRRARLCGERPDQRDRDPDEPGSGPPGWCSG